MGRLDTNAGRKRHCSAAAPRELAAHTQAEHTPACTTHARTTHTHARTAPRMCFTQHLFGRSLHSLAAQHRLPARWALPTASLSSKAGRGWVSPAMRPFPAALGALCAPGCTRQGRGRERVDGRAWQPAHRSVLSARPWVPRTTREAGRGSCDDQKDPGTQGREQEDAKLGRVGAVGGPPPRSSADTQGPCGTCSVCVFPVSRRQSPWSCEVGLGGLSPPGVEAWTQGPSLQPSGRSEQETVPLPPAPPRRAPRLSPLRGPPARAEQRPASCTFVQAPAGALAGLLPCSWHCPTPPAASCTDQPAGLLVLADFRQPPSSHM